VPAVTGSGATAGIGTLLNRLCRLAVEELTLSGCAVVLMSGAVQLGTFGGAGRHAATIAELQFELGEGPRGIGTFDRRQHQMAAVHAAGIRGGIPRDVRCAAIALISERALRQGMLAAYLMTTVDEPSSCCEPTHAATTASVPMAPTVSLKRRFCPSRTCRRRHWHAAPTAGCRTTAKRGVVTLTRQAGLRNAHHETLFGTTAHPDWYPLNRSSALLNSPLSRILMAVHHSG
jgi:hypothetical protein